MENIVVNTELPEYMLQKKDLQQQTKKLVRHNVDSAWSLSEINTSLDLSDLSPPVVGLDDSFESPRPQYGVKEVENVFVPLSDGVRLAARLWIPQTEATDEKFSGLFHINVDSI